jgi:hypothetical protein
MPRALCERGRRATAARACLVLHEAQDGWLARVRVPAAAERRQLAERSRAPPRWATGWSDLTSTRQPPGARAAATMPVYRLARFLREAGCCPPRPDDRARNVVPSPLPRRHPAALAAPTAVGRRLDRRCARTRRWRSCPGASCSRSTTAAAWASATPPTWRCVARDAQDVRPAGAASGRPRHRERDRRPAGCAAVPPEWRPGRSLDRAPPSSPHGRTGGGGSPSSPDGAASGRARARREPGPGRLRASAVAPSRLAGAARRAAGAHRARPLGRSTPRRLSGVGRRSAARCGCSTERHDHARSTRRARRGAHGAPAWACGRGRVGVGRADGVRGARPLRQGRRGRPRRRRAARRVRAAGRRASTGRRASGAAASAPGQPVAVVAPRSASPCAGATRSAWSPTCPRGAWRCSHDRLRRATAPRSTAARSRRSAPRPTSTARRRSWTRVGRG